MYNVCVKNVKCIVKFYSTSNVRNFFQFLAKGFISFSVAQALFVNR